MQMKNKNLAREVAQNSIWQFVSTLISRIGALVFTIILARFLLPEEFGNYSLVLSVALIFATIVELGVNETFLRYFSEALVKKDKKKIPSYFKYMLGLKFRITAFFSLSLIVLAWPIAFVIFKKPFLFLPLLFSAIYIFVFAFENFFNQLFFSVRKLKFIFLKEIISQSVRIISVLIVLIFFAKKYYIAGIFLGLILASSAVLIFNFISSRRLLPYLFKKSEKILDSEKKRILSFFKYLVLGAVFIVLFTYVDVIMLGILIPDSSYIGYYRAAFTLVSNIAAFIAFGNVLLPVFTQIKRENLEKAFNRAFRYLMILTIPASFGLFILGRYFIRLIFGYNYLSATLPLSFLSFLIIPSVATSLFLNLFSAEEKPRLYIPLLAIVLSSNILLNYLFITFFSRYSFIWATAGSAMAVLLSAVIYFLGLYILSIKLLKIKAKISYMIKPFFASLVMVFILWLITKKITDMTFITGLIEVLLGMLIYFGLMIIIKGIVKEDILLLKGVLINFKGN